MSDKHVKVGDKTGQASQDTGEILQFQADKAEREPYILD